jgi:hypothetical protein
MGLMPPPYGPPWDSEPLIQARTVGIAASPHRLVVWMLHLPADPFSLYTTAPVVVAASPATLASTPQL